MAAGESTELVRYVTEGELLYPAGDLRIVVRIDPALLARADTAHAQLRKNLRGVASRRIVFPSDERATIIDQD